jgi:uncharacterized membrane protein YecN with MAPEG domain
MMLIIFHSNQTEYQIPSHLVFLINRVLRQTIANYCQTLGCLFARVLVSYTNGHISSLLQAKEVYMNVQFLQSNIPIIISGYMMYVTPLNIEIVETFPPRKY